MKRPWALRLARSYARYRLSRAMDGVWVRGLAEAAAVAKAGPVLFVATHAAWWDAFVLAALDEALGTDGYVLMDAAQLSRFPFFRALGAIPLDRSSFPAMRRGLREAERALGRGCALWIFPQGRHRPPHLRPLGLARGWRRLAAVPGASVVPVALSYAFREAPQPSACVSFEAPGDPEAGLLAGLDRVDRFVDVGDPAFHALVPARGARIDASPATRLLAALTGGPRG